MAHPGRAPSPRRSSDSIARLCGFALLPARQATRMSEATTVVELETRRAAAAGPTRRRARQASARTASRHDRHRRPRAGRRHRPDLPPEGCAARPRAAPSGDSSKEALRTRSTVGPPSPTRRCRGPCRRPARRWSAGCGIDSSPPMRKSRPVAAFTWFASSPARRSGGKAALTAAQVAAASRAKTPSRIAAIRPQRRFGEAAAVTPCTAIYFAPIACALSSGLAQRLRPAGGDRPRFRLVDDAVGDLHPGVGRLAPVGDAREHLAGRPSESSAISVISPADETIVRCRPPPVSGALM